MASTADKRRGRKSHDFRVRREQFDTAWQGTKTPVIESFLPVSETAESHGYSRRQLLLELVEIDLECRWKAGFPRSHFDSTDDRLPTKPRVEDYLEWFPELGSADQLPVDFILQEYKARRDAGEQIEHEEFVARFPTQAERLRAELREIDTNIEPTARFIRCPQCHSSIAVPELRAVALEVVTCECGEKVPIIDARNGDQHEGEIVDSYELTRWLGRGSFANVWLAFDQRLERHVALKIPYKRRKGEGRPNLILNEAKISAGLKHPNIVQVYELGKGDEAYIASEYIKGHNLEVSLRVSPRAPEDTAALCRKMAEALHYLHGKGIVHRDVKPSNILLDEHDEPHLTDFGLAKRESESIALSSAGELIGTVAYMSPEQAAGKGHLADARADLFSLGIVMYEMLAGTLPFHGDRLTIMNKIQKEDPPSILKHAPKTPRDLETICFRCLEKEPAKRFATAAELAGELGRFLRGEPILTRPASRFERLRKWAKRHPARAIAAAMSTVAAAAIIVALGLALQRSRDQYDTFRERVARAIVLKEEIDVALIAPSTLKQINAVGKDIAELEDLFDQIREMAPSHTWAEGNPGGEPADEPTIVIENAKKALEDARIAIELRADHDAKIMAIEAAAVAAIEPYQEVMAVFGAALLTGMPTSDNALHEARPRRSPVADDAQTQRIAAQTQRIAAEMAQIPDDKKGKQTAEVEINDKSDSVGSLPPTESRMPIFSSNDEDSLRAMRKSAGTALAMLGIAELQPSKLNAQTASLLWNRMRKAEENAVRIASNRSPKFHDQIESLQHKAAELILLHAFATFQLGEPNALTEVLCAERLGLVTPHAAPRDPKGAPTSDDIEHHVAHTYRQMVAEFTAKRDTSQPTNTAVPVPDNASWFDHFFAGCRRLPRHAADDRQSMYAAALYHFNASHKIWPESPWTCYCMAVCYIRTGEHKAAVDKLIEHEKKVGKFPFTFILRGIARSQIFRRDAVRNALAFDEAQSDFNQALESIGEAETEARMAPAVARRLRFAVHMSRGALYFDASRRTPESLEKAAADFTTAREEARLLGDELRVEQACGQLAIVAWYRGKASEALRELNTLVDKRPVQGASKASLLMVRAEMRLGTDLTGAAEDFYAVFTGNASTPEQQASAGVNYAWTAGLAIANGDWEAAIRVCDVVTSMAIREDSSASKTIQQRALDAHLIAAIVRLREARKLAPQAVQLAHTGGDQDRADVRAKLERAALASLDAYLASGGDDPKVFEMRASLRFRLGGRKPDLAGAAEDYGRAAELLRKAADQSPPRSNVRLRIEKDELRVQRLRGWCLARVGQAPQAVAAFDRAIYGLGDATMQTRIGRGFASVLAEQLANGIEDADYVAKHSTDAYDLYQAAGIYALAARQSLTANGELRFPSLAQQSLVLLQRALERSVDDHGNPLHSKAARICAFGSSRTFQAVQESYPRLWLQLMRQYAPGSMSKGSVTGSRATPIRVEGGGK